MAPTILVIGAAGNTGKSVVRHLRRLLEATFPSYRVLGLTRSVDSPKAQKLVKLPHVEVQERDWTTIDAAWLRSQEVVRAYVAPHNLSHQFAEESNLHLALLQAGVKYVAIENLLSQPDFKSLQWTSLQPKFFTASYLAFASNCIKAYQKSCEQETLLVVVAADAALATIHLEDVGIDGAHHLALEDTIPHNNARYVLSGPEDVTGRDLVKFVEQYAGAKVGKAELEDTSFLSGLTKSSLYPEKAMPSFLICVEDFLCSMKDVLPTSRVRCSCRFCSFVVEEHIRPQAISCATRLTSTDEAGAFLNAGQRASLSASDGSRV